MQGDTKGDVRLTSSQRALLSVSDCQKVLSVALREQTCHQQINRRLNKVFGNLVAAILVINYRKASVNL